MDAISKLEIMLSLGELTENQQDSALSWVIYNVPKSEWHYAALILAEAGAMNAYTDLRMRMGEEGIV